MVESEEQVQLSFFPIFLHNRGYTMSHPMTKARPNYSAKKAPGAAHRDGPQAPAWPSFTGTSQFVGVSPSGLVTVFVDPALGPLGLQNAQDLVNNADGIMTANNAIFGAAAEAVNVIIFALGGATDGTGGADHDGCDFTTGAAIEVDASFGSAARVSGLFEAELSECMMGGNLCGVSTGEALSRWCASVISNNALADFVTAPTWFNDGPLNFVDQTDPTDQNADSTGCGMAFLSWLLSLGHGLDTIAQAMVSLGDSGTLAQLYADLTGNPAANAWPTFIAAVQALPGGVTSDDPFNGAPQAAQLTQRASLASVAQAAKILASIIADLGAGKAAHQITANVSAILGLAAKPSSAAGARCSTKSRRLLPTK
jgi:hypothetical protein